MVLALEVLYVGYYLMVDANFGWWEVFYLEQFMKLVACVINDVGRYEHVVFVGFVNWIGVLRLH